ncbi:MAG: glycosyl hydrolase family 57 [Candidatus Omnitrophica bacterium]|nr:glycosyl hydrolase family 57 [Candidatus Omnitrophota bacterium]
MKDIVAGLPNIFSQNIKSKERKKTEKELFAPFSSLPFDKINTAFAIALHMHQPTIPAQGDDLARAGLISNLEYMMKHQNIGDNHNAPVFLSCYSRMSDIIRELLDKGLHPRIMLDYSGNLLWGLRQMGEAKVLDNLSQITVDKKYYPSLEWLGTMWSHAVVSSTPVPDISLHIRAWRNHFGAIFGQEALNRLKGFSAPEMQLPIHPDVCFEYIKALKEAGYEWLLVQEHTIENLDGSPIRRPHFPHRLIAKNSFGKTQEIAVFIKTQGSDTKLVAQMQPYYEAKSRQREEYAKKSLPPLVLQISDGENGGVMMNEFPPKYKEVFNEIGREGTVALNVSEYFEYIKRERVKEEDFLPVQPISQHKIWEFVNKFSPRAVEEAIQKAKNKYGQINLEKASWTNDKNWVKGYMDILDPINKLSARFHERFDDTPMDCPDPKYRQALLYLLLSQTSCFRYWGKGIWTEYAREICRRGMEAIEKS